MSVTELVAANIKKIRTEQKLSQEKLAELAGCSKNHISAIERGKKYPSAALMDRIIEILHTKPFLFYLDSDDIKRFYFSDTLIELAKDSLKDNEASTMLFSRDSTHIID